MDCPSEERLVAALRLAADQRPTLTAHLDACGDCRRLALALVASDLSTHDGPAEAIARPRPSSTLAPGATVGRFVIHELIAEGGFGTVYQATDPILQRRVALKRTRNIARALEPEVQERLVREAQGLARLSHPNVVAVYDVGQHDGEIFLALEHISGAALDRWLVATARSWREILEVLEAAGRGVIAAHAVGLVHRDLKPQNVMVGADGAVKVIDFGLVRLGDEGAAAAVASPTEGAPELTFSGAFLGTPAYASPEQLEGGEISAQSDVFSFCVMAYEALLGRRPLPDAPAAARLAAIEGGELAEASAGQRVPIRLRRLLARGLQRDPAARPTLAELLAGFRRESHRRLRWAGVAAALVVAGLSLGVVGHRALRQAPDPCGGGPARLAAVWRPARAAEIARALRTSRRPDAEAAWQHLAATLDRQAAAWLTMHRETCLATVVRHEQSTDLLDRRMVCLDDRLAALEAAIALFARADASVVGHADELAAALAPVSDCADLNSLMARDPLPAAGAPRATLAELQRVAAAAKALLAVGQSPQAEIMAKDLDRRAAELGYRPMRASVAVLQGEIALDLGDDAIADGRFRKAYQDAVASGDDAEAVTALTYRARTQDLLGAAAAQVDDTFAMAQAWAERLHDPQVARDVRKSHAELLVSSRNDFAAAKAEADQLLGEVRPAGAAPSDEALRFESDLYFLRSVAEGQDFRKAIDDLGRALALQRELFKGAPSESQATLLENLGDLHEVLGEDVQAAPLWRRALDMLTALDLSEDQPRILLSRARLLSGIDPGAARKALRRATDLVEQHGDDYGGQIAVELSSVGMTPLALLDDEASLRASNVALRLFERRFGATSPQVADGLVSVAGTLYRMDRFPGARDAAERALAIWAAHPEAHPGRTINGRVCREIAGVARFHLGDFAGALALMTAAERDRLAERPAQDDTNVPPNEFFVVAARYELGQDRSANRQRARAILRQYRAQDASAKGVAVMQAWLARAR